MDLFPAAGRLRCRSGLGRRDVEDLLRDLHQRPNQRLRWRRPAHAARRPGSVPIFLQQQASSGGTTITGALQWVVRWRPSHSPLRDNVADLQHAIEHHSPTGRFTIAASPGGDRALSDKRLLPPWDASLEALAEAMRPEYDAIVAAATAHVLRFVGADACTSRVACFCWAARPTCPLCSCLERSAMRVFAPRLACLRNSLPGLTAPVLRFDSCHNMAAAARHILQHAPEHLPCSGFPWVVSPLCMLRRLHRSGCAASPYSTRRCCPCPQRSVQLAGREWQRRSSSAPAPLWSSIAANVELLIAH